MGRLLAKVLLAVLLVVMSGGPLCAAPVETADPVAHSLALLQQVDLRTLPAEQRKALLVGLADQLEASGQPLRALDFLARALDETAAPPSEALLRKIDALLSRLDRSALEQVVFLAPGTEIAQRAQRLLGSGSTMSVPAPARPSVGVLLPLSGRSAPFGEAVRQGLELAFRESGAMGPGLVYRDTAAENAAISVLVQEFAARPELLAIIGPMTSSLAAAAAAGAEAARLPLLLLAPREGQTGGYVFRHALTPAVQARELAEFACRREGLRRFAVLHPDDRHGELHASLFKAAVELEGGTVVARRSYPPGVLDLRNEMEALAAAVRAGGGAEALFLPDEARQVAQIIPQLAFPRLDDLQLLGISAWSDPELARLAGPLSEGAIFVDGFFVESPQAEVREFVAAFQGVYGALPNILNAYGYDTGRILLSLLARPDLRDREALRRGLATLRNFPGATGATGFTAGGETDKALFLLQIQDGTAVQIN